MSFQTRFTPPFQTKDGEVGWEAVARIRLRDLGGGPDRIETRTWEAGEDPELSPAWSEIDAIIATLPPGARVRVELLNGASEPIISRTAKGPSFDHPVPEVETIKKREEPMARRGEEEPAETEQQTTIKVQGGVAETALVQLCELVRSTVNANTDLAKHSASVGAGERDRMGRRREEALVKLGRLEATLSAREVELSEKNALIEDISKKMEQIAGQEAGSFEKMSWPERWAFLSKMAQDMKGFLRPTDEQIAAIIDAILKKFIAGETPALFSRKIKDLSKEDRRKLFVALQDFVMEHFADEMNTVDAS